MKTILCYGDSNLRGFIPGSFDPVTGLAGRYPKNKRWVGILQKQLGEDYDVVEDGLNGRTTTLDEINPGRVFRNGLTQLPMSLEADSPIALVILLLGTNDTKIQFNRSASDIAAGMRQLIQLVKSSKYGPDATAPKILLLAPQPIIQVANLHPEFQGDAMQKSQQLGQLYQQLAQAEGCDFLDLGQIVTSSLLDGVHLDESQCGLLGQVLLKKIRAATLVAEFIQGP